MTDLVVLAERYLTASDGLDSLDEATHLPSRVSGAIIEKRYLSATALGVRAASHCLPFVYHAFRFNFAYTFDRETSAEIPLEYFEDDGYDGRYLGVAREVVSKSSK